MLRPLLASTVGLLLLASCGFGGDEYGSDEWHDEEAQRVEREAATTLDAALMRLDPCSPDRAQTVPVLEALRQTAGPGRRGFAHAARQSGAGADRQVAHARSTTQRDQHPRVRG